jgi:hypothetical protein
MSRRKAAIDGNPTVTDRCSIPCCGRSGALMAASRAPGAERAPSTSICPTQDPARRTGARAWRHTLRLDAHRLIEEFMIAANVAAAEELEAKRTPLIYRVHDQPSKEKLAALAEFLGTLGLKLPKTASSPRISTASRRDRASPAAELVGEMILRSQAQAEYNAGNFGHFGLNLRRYAHFTSRSGATPI